MGYFDSPKNNAKWEIEMKGLRAKREDFEKHPEKRNLGTHQAGMNRAEKSNPMREHVTFKQLESEENALKPSRGGRNNAATPAVKKMGDRAVSSNIKLR